MHFYLTLLRLASNNTENQFIAFSDYSWQDCPDTGRITGEYIIFYQGVPTYHVTPVTGPVAQSSSEINYNAACTLGIDLSHFRVLIREFLNKGSDIIPEEASLIILNSKSVVCVVKNGKYTNHTKHISRRVHFVLNGEKCKMHKIYWCEGGLKFVDIATTNVGEIDLNPRMIYIMVRLYN